MKLPVVSASDAVKAFPQGADTSSMCNTVATSFSGTPIRRNMTTFPFQAIRKLAKGTLRTLNFAKPGLR